MHTIGPQTCSSSKGATARARSGYATRSQAVRYPATLHRQSSSHSNSIIINMHCKVGSVHARLHHVTRQPADSELSCVSLACLGRLIPDPVAADCYFAGVVQQPDCLHLGHRPTFVHSETVPDVHALAEEHSRMHNLRHPVKKVTQTQKQEHREWPRKISHVTMAPEMS